MTGAPWLGLIPLVTLAFLITYAHKYTWDSLAHAKGLHIALGMAGAGLFLVIPLIFLTNVNLMLFPGRWLEVDGFLSALEGARRAVSSARSFSACSCTALRIVCQARTWVATSSGYCAASGCESSKATR